MKIAIVSANLGNFDPPAPWPMQELPPGVSLDVHRLTDAEFAPRLRSMTPRLQARLVKCFAWQLLPGYDLYLWMDASMALRDAHSVASLLARCGLSAQAGGDFSLAADLVVFRHPERSTIRAEYEYIKQRLVADDSDYFRDRYQGELYEEQMAEIAADSSYVDDRFYANTCFLYANRPAVQAMLKEWWYQISRYNTSDQSSFPYVIAKSGVRVGVLEEHFCATPFFERVRPEDWKIKLTVNGETRLQDRPYLGWDKECEAAPVPCRGCQQEVEWKVDGLAYNRDGSPHQCPHNYLTDGLSEVDRVAALSRRILNSVNPTRNPEEYRRRLQEELRRLHPDQLHLVAYSEELLRSASVPRPTGEAPQDEPAPSS